MVIDTDIHKVINQWPAEWHTPSDFDVRTSKGTRSSTAHKRKDTTKQATQNFVALRNKEATKKAQMEKERTAKQQVEQEQHESERSGKSPSPKTEEEE